MTKAPKSSQHEIVRTELFLHWAHRRRDLKVASGAPLRLSRHDAPEPDLIVFPATLLAPDVRADTVLLVVEIADTSLARRPRHQSAALCRCGRTRILGDQRAQPPHRRASRAARQRRVRASRGTPGDGAADAEAGTVVSPSGSRDLDLGPL